MQNLELVGVYRWHVKIRFQILNFSRCTELYQICLLRLVVVYNFDGNITHGLQLTIGETVHILEECAGKRDLILIIDSQLVYQQSFNA